MLAGALPVCHAGAAQSGQAVASPAGFAEEEALYAHAVVGSDDGEAWQAWQSVHDESLRVSDPSEKYFFLPTSADSERVDVYNGFETAVTVGDTEIAPHTTATLSYSTAQGCSVRAGNKTFTLNYMPTRRAMPPRRAPSSRPTARSTTLPSRRSRGAATPRGASRKRATTSPMTRR